MAGVVLLARSTRPCEAMHGHAWTFSEQVIASIIYDRSCGMSDIAFRIASPIGGLSCLIYQKLLELATSRFATISPPRTIFTFRPEMTSQSTSGRQQIEQTCQFGGHARVAICRWRFNRFLKGLQRWKAWLNASSRILWCTRHFCFLNSKMEFRWTNKLLKISSHNFTQA